MLSLFLSAPLPPACSPSEGASHQLPSHIIYLSTNNRLSNRMSFSGSPLRYLNTTLPSDISSDSFLNPLFNELMIPELYTIHFLLPINFLLTHPDLHTFAVLCEKSPVDSSLYPQTVFSPILSLHLSTMPAGAMILHQPGLKYTLG